MRITKWGKQVWKNMCYVIPTTWYSEKGKTIERIKRSAITRVSRERKGWKVGIPEIFREVKLFFLIL